MCRSRPVEWSPCKSFSMLTVMHNSLFGAVSNSFIGTASLEQPHWNSLIGPVSLEPSRWSCCKRESLVGQRSWCKNLVGERSRCKNLANGLAATPGLPGMPIEYPISASLFLSKYSRSHGSHRSHDENHFRLFIFQAIAVDRLCSSLINTVDIR